ncbi:protein GbcA [Pseudomonas sp. BN411]|nr:protein GbcA [Pseudomonas sp. BN411]
MTLLRPWPEIGLLRRIVNNAKTAHLPVCDIHMLIATCQQPSGLARRKRMSPCRPWARSCLPAPAH